jgi:hypothetical protein
MCASSKGEIFINNFLSKNNIYFIKEHAFSSCKNKRELPFDFYIPSLNTCIEYDGILHYEDKFGNEEEFKKGKKRDKIKTKYCKDNGIYLIRIPYWDYKNIDLILELKLSIIENKINGGTK